MNKPNYYCALVNNGEYCNFYRNGHAYLPNVRGDRGPFTSIEEAEDHGKEVWTDDLAQGDHLLVYHFDDELNEVIDIY